MIHLHGHNFNQSWQIDCDCLQCCNMLKCQTYIIYSIFYKCFIVNSVWSSGHSNVMIIIVDHVWMNVMARLDLDSVQPILLCQITWKSMTHKGRKANSVSILTTNFYSFDFGKIFVSNWRRWRDPCYWTLAIITYSTTEYI